MALEALGAMFLIIAMRTALCNRELDTSEAHPIEDISILGKATVMGDTPVLVHRLSRSSDFIKQRE